MDLRRRLYPYPILSELTNDYKNSSFGLDVKVSHNEDELQVFFFLSLENEEIWNLINSDKAEFLIHLECAHTFYRTVIKTDKTEESIIIPDSKLSGVLTVCAFIVAKENISEFKNKDFNDDYEGVGFSLHRGNIIAIGGQVNIKITKELAKLSKIPSIFTICRRADDIEKSMIFDLSGQKITITLCGKSFNNYKTISTATDMLPVLHSMLIVPALIYTFDVLKNEGTKKYEDLRWFKSLERALIKLGLKLDKEALEAVPSFELAEKCLNMPIDRALNALAVSCVQDEED